MRKKDPRNYEFCLVSTTVGEHGGQGTPVPSSQRPRASAAARRCDPGAQAPGLARIEAEVQNDRLPRLGRDRGEVSLVMHIAVIAQPLRKAFRTV